MLHFILIMCSTVISFIFMQMKHPLAMGMIILIQTFLICMITGTMVKTFWFSYVLFLIFLGGMLVLFIYVTSLASNEMFNFSTNLLLMSTIFIFISMILFIMIDPMIMNNFLMNMEMIQISNFTNFLKENTINLNKLYNFPTNLITLLMINYLFLTLIVIVKITNNFLGPLRPKT